MKKQYNTPLSETIAFHAEPLMENSIVINKNKSGDQNLSNDRDFDDSWDDFEE